MEFMEIDKANSFIARGAATAMGLDVDGNIFYVLQVDGINQEGNDVLVQIVLPPMVTEQFLKVVGTMETKNE